MFFNTNSKFSCTVKFFWSILIVTVPVSSELPIYFSYLVKL